MGGPKALVELDGEPLVRRGWRALGDAGLARRLVVLGARAEQVRTALPPDARTVVADDWAEGMGASLRAGLAELVRCVDPGPVGEPVEAVLVTLVDTPGIPAAALRRVAAACDGPGTLARGAFAGEPGHPVLLGRAHWDAVLAVAHGDRGARDHLRGHPDLRLVEIGDVADPGDVDTPGDLDHLRMRRS